MQDQLRALQLAMLSGEQGSNGALPAQMQAELAALEALAEAEGAASVAAAQRLVAQHLAMSRSR